MKLFKERAGLAAVLLLTAAAIVGLAVLQYRWNRQASEATGVRLTDALQLSMVNWHLDLFRNLSEVCLTIRMAAEFSPDNDFNQFVDRFAEWRSIARYSDLVANVYVVDRASPDVGVQTFHLKPDAGTFARVQWPTALGSLAVDLGSTFVDAPAAGPEPATRPPVDRELLQHWCGAARLAVRARHSGADPTAERRFLGARPCRRRSSRAVARHRTGRAGSPLPDSP
jgi:hypothetical protein